MLILFYCHSKICINNLNTISHHWLYLYDSLSVLYYITSSNLQKLTSTSGKLHMFCKTFHYCKCEQDMTFRWTQKSLKWLVNRMSFRNYISSCYTTLTHPRNVHSCYYYVSVNSFSHDNLTRNYILYFL